MWYWAKRFQKEMDGTDYWYLRAWWATRDAIGWRPNWYYNIKQFCRNLPLFLRLAWKWRGWDSHYSIMAFVELLKATAKSIKKYGHLANSEKRYRKCMMAAGLLDKAYNTEISKSLDYLYTKNKWYTERCKDAPHLYEMKTDYKTPEHIYNAMWDIAHKRDEKEQAERKQYAWKFIHKHIEYWWD